MTVVGFPHSDIHGSILACSSPWLFAAYRVLHRLLAPRHPPYALSSLTFQLLRTKTFLVFLFLLVNSFLHFAISEVPDGLINRLVFLFFCEVFKVQRRFVKTFKTKQNLSKCASTEVYEESSSLMSP